jgi:hypothetical protein
VFSALFNLRFSVSPYSTIASTFLGQPRLLDHLARDARGDVLVTCFADYGAPVLDVCVRFCKCIRLV